MSDARAFTIRIDKGDVGLRLDAVVGTYVPELSRSHASTLIKSGAIKVGNGSRKPGYKVREGDTITGVIPSVKPVELRPEPVPIRVVFEDHQLMVLDKAAGLVVHPSPGHPTATLVHGLLFHCPDVQSTGDQLRPGIVHRLDKDTSGLLIVAKNPTAHEHLSAQFQNRTIKKEYLALVWGTMEAGSGNIGLPVGRHHRERKRMSVHSSTGRPAETFWRVKDQFSQAALLHLHPKTGRTHQIRVHCAAIGHPILGDPVYNRKKRNQLTWADGTEIQIRRQMLHAWKIAFAHPSEKRTMKFEAPVPEDMKEVLEFLRGESDAYAPSFKKSR